MKKIGKYERIQKIQNPVPSNCGPNHGANERPKGDKVALGDLKARPFNF